MTEYVCLNVKRRPMAVRRADDPLVRETYAWAQRMRQRVVRLREEADRIEASADSAEPVPVVVVGGESTTEDDCTCGPYELISDRAADAIAGLFLADAEARGVPTEPWRCTHRPRCADAACSDNPAMRGFLGGPDMSRPRLNEYEPCVGDTVTAHNLPRVPVGSIAAHPGVHHTPIWLRNDRQWVGFGGKVPDALVRDHGLVLLRVGPGVPTGDNDE